MLAGLAMFVSVFSTSTVPQRGGLGNRSLSGAPDVRGVRPHVAIRDDWAVHQNLKEGPRPLNTYFSVSKLTWDLRSSGPNVSASLSGFSRSFEWCQGSHSAFTAYMQTEKWPCACGCAPPFTECCGTECGIQGEIDLDSGDSYDPSPRRTQDFEIQRGLHDMYAGSNGSWGVKASTQSYHWTEYRVTGSSFHIYSLPYAAPSDYQLSGSSMGDISGARAPKRGPESHLHMDLVIMAMYIRMKGGWPLTTWGACRFILASFTGLWTVICVSPIHGGSCFCHESSVMMEQLLLQALVWLGYLVSGSGSTSMQFVLMVCLLPRVGAFCKFCGVPSGYFCDGGQTCPFLSMCHPCESAESASWLGLIWSVLNSAILILFAKRVSLCVFFAVLPRGHAVTCLTCHDQLDGCAGGNACPFLQGPTSNVQALAAGAGTLLMHVVNPALRAVLNLVQWAAHHRREVIVATGFAFFAVLPRGHAVTCLTCHDQLDGCAGGNACPFLQGPTSNVQALAAGAGTLLMAAKIFPREYLKVLTRSVLDTIKAVSKRALPGDVPIISGWSVAKLLAAFRDCTVPRPDIVMELTSLIPGSTDAEKETIKLALSSMDLFSKMESNSGGTSRRAGESVGVLGLMWALAGRIVERRNDTVTVFSNSDSPTDSTSVASKLTEKKSLSASAETFCERISVFTSTCHGLGVENVMSLTFFFREVAFNVMNRDKLPWQLAHMVVEIYLEDVDNSTSLTIGNILASGGTDSRMARARTLTEERFGQGIFRSGTFGRATGGGAPPVDGGAPWDCKGTPDSSLGFCNSYNYKQTHPSRSLKADGTCKFKHACMQWVTGKGADGCCEGKHPRKDCKNPGKSTEKDRL